MWMFYQFFLCPFVFCAAIGKTYCTLTCSVVSHCYDVLFSCVWLLMCSTVDFWLGIRSQTSVLNLFHCLLFFLVFLWFYTRTRIWQFFRRTQLDQFLPGLQWVIIANLYAAGYPSWCEQGKSHIGPLDLILSSYGSGGNVLLCVLLTCHKIEVLSIQ